MKFPAERPVSFVNLRACLTGLLFGSGSASSRGVLPNVFLEKLFLSKRRRSQSRFDEIINYVFSKTILTSLQESLMKNRGKHPLKSAKLVYQS
jgi:hypothetical protein